MDGYPRVVVVGRVLRVREKDLSFIQLLKQANPSTEEIRAKTIARVIRAVLGEKDTPDEIITDIYTYLAADTPLEKFMTEPNSSTYGLEQLHRYINRAITKIPVRFGRVAGGYYLPDQIDAIQDLRTDAKTSILLAAYSLGGEQYRLSTSVDQDIYLGQLTRVPNLRYISIDDEIKEACRYGNLNERLAIEHTPRLATVQPPDHLRVFRIKTRMESRTHHRFYIEGLTDADFASWNYAEGE